LGEDEIYVILLQETAIPIDDEATGEYNMDNFRRAGSLMWIA
jgi:hypothetical protein